MPETELKMPWDDEGFLNWLSAKSHSWKDLCRAYNSKDFEELKGVIASAVKFGMAHATELQCPECEHGVSGEDYFGEAIDCRYCDQHGFITVDAHIQLYDQLQSVVGDAMLNDTVHSSELAAKDAEIERLRGETAKLKKLMKSAREFSEDRRTRIESKKQEVGWLQQSITELVEVLNIARAHLAEDAVQVGRNSTNGDAFDCMYHASRVEEIHDKIDAVLAKRSESQVKPT